MRHLARIIRNTALLAVAAIVVLAGVLLLNAFTHGSRQIQVSAVPRVPIDQQAAAARLSEAIPFKTISNFLNPEQDAEALHGLQAHIAKSFPAFHAAASARSSAVIACSTPGRARMRRRYRSRYWHIRTWCRSPRAPRRTGNNR